MDGGAWWAAVHGVAKSQTRLSDFTFTFHFHALEKEMATHSSVLAWRIPGTGEPGELPPMGSHRVGHDWSDLAAAAAANCRYMMYSRSLELILYKETLYPLENSFSFYCQPLATAILFSASVTLTMSDTLCKWNHVVFSWDHVVFSFCDCLISFSIISSRLIHIV